MPAAGSPHISVTFAGLGDDEATAIVASLPVGATAAVAVTAPTIGSLTKRFKVTVENLTPQELEQANTRADKADTRAADAEKELAELNKQVREQTMVQLVRATDAISRAYELLAEHGERGRPR